MREGALQGSTMDATAAFWRELEDVNLELGAVQLTMNEAKSKLELMGIALSKSQTAPGELDKRLHDLSE